MKTCTKCHRVKPESEYYTQDKTTGRLHAECKACYAEQRKSYAAMHYLKYGDKYRERARIRRARIKKELRLKISDYLRYKSCERCGENDLIVLDFDHIDPRNKTSSIARMLTNGLEWELIMSEISKCRILCANCHRRVTASQQGWYKSRIKI